MQALPLIFNTLKMHNPHHLPTVDLHAVEGLLSWQCNILSTVSFQALQAWQGQRCCIKSTRKSITCKHGHDKRVYECGINLLIMWEASLAILVAHHVLIG